MIISINYVGLQSKAQYMRSAASFDYYFRLVPTANQQSIQRIAQCFLYNAVSLIILVTD